MPLLNRSASDIDYITIHTAEGYYQGTISWFQNPASPGSAHYVVSKNGDITRTVYDEDIAKHLQNISIRNNSIGIEHEGFVDDPNWAKLPDRKKMYLQSAKLVRYKAIQYGIPRNRTYIVGHGEIDIGISGAHIDPWYQEPFTNANTYWDWDYYIRLVNDDTGPQIEIKDNQNNIIANGSVINSVDVNIEVNDGTDGSGIDILEIRKDDPDTGQLLFSDDTDYDQNHSYLSSAIGTLPEGHIFVKVIDQMDNPTLHEFLTPTSKSPF